MDIDWTVFSKEGGNEEGETVGQGLDDPNVGNACSVLHQGCQIEGLRMEHSGVWSSLDVDTKPPSSHQSTSPH